MTLYTKAYQFQPKLLSTLMTIVGLCLLIALGFWQLDRAQQKTMILDQYSARSKAKPLQLNKIKSIADKYDFRNIEVSGVFDNAHIFLLDNQFYQHRVGYQVLTPLYPKGDDKVVLINRGWIPRGVERSKLPVIQPITGQHVLQGIIALPNKKAFTLSNHPENPQQWPRIIEKIDLQQIGQILQRRVFQFVIKLSPQSAHGFARHWTPVIMKPARHIGYAVQWFSLALTLLIIYIFVNCKPKEVNDETQSNYKTSQ